MQGVVYRYEPNASMAKPTIKDEHMVNTYFAKLRRLQRNYKYLWHSSALSGEPLTLMDKVSHKTRILPLLATYNLFSQEVVSFVRGLLVLWLQHDSRRP